MALPAKQKIWTIDPCNRVAYASLVQVMRDPLYQLSVCLLANGYTCKGSSDGVTGAMDAVNRWTGGAAAGVRGANITTPNSWIVLVDGNGCNIILSYVGATDDVCRISYSHSGVAAAAGTPTHTPTSADERVMVSGTTIIGATASGDRLWTAWVDSDHTGFRMAIARAGAWVTLWGVEEVASVVAPSVTWSPPTWGFFYTAANMTIIAVAGGNAQYGANAKGGVSRINVGGMLDIVVGGGAESLANNSAGLVGRFADVTAELQAGGYPLSPISAASGTTGARGKLGNRYDWWTGRTTGAADGDHYGNTEFVQIGECVWPWDGTPSVAGTAIVMT